VKEFQTAQSLEADGVVGPRTRAKLIPTAEKPESKEEESAAAAPQESNHEEPAQAATPTPVPAPATEQQPMASWWLARGAMGQAVKEIQQFLGVPVDGFFGPRTEHAVREFQRAHALDADGIVGPRTRDEISRVQAISTEKKEVAPPQPTPQAAAPAVVAQQHPAMEQLLNMGFPDITLNATLLGKHNGDVEQVIAELLGA